MKTNTKLAILVTLFLSQLARADSPPVIPLADELIAKSIQAVGGKEKLIAIKSSSIKGTISIALQNMNGTIEMLQKGSNAIITMNMGQLGVIHYGMTDKIGYEQTDLMGTRLLKDDEKQQLTQGLDVQAQVEHVSKLKDLAITGPEKIGELQAWKISGKNEQGENESHWIDIASNQTIKSELTISSPMGKLPATVEFADFKTIDGITMPMNISQSVGPIKMNMQLTEIKLNPEIPDEKFALPDEVKQLVAQATSQPTTQPGEKTEANP